MQNVQKIQEEWTIANSLAPMNENWQSLLSNNSGISFPVSNLELGQACFRTDELALYVLANVHDKLWVKIAQLTLTYVDKEYVDSMHIDLSRVDNLIDPLTKKVKMSLMYTGVENGQLVEVGDNNHIATSLIDTGTRAGQIVKVNEDGKIPSGVLNLGVQEGQIPILVTKGKLNDSVIPDNVAVFNDDGSLTFPSGNTIFIGS